MKISKSFRRRKNQKGKYLCEQYKIFSEEEKDKRRQYERGRCKNLCEDGNQRLVECIIS